MDIVVVLLTSTTDSFKDNEASIRRDSQKGEDRWQANRQQSAAK